GPVPQWEGINGLVAQDPESGRKRDGEGGEGEEQASVTQEPAAGNRSAGRARGRRSRQGEVTVGHGGVPEERSGAHEQRARENQREPEGDARPRNVAETGPEKRRVRLLALPQSIHGAREQVDVREQQREQRNLESKHHRPSARL